MINSLSKEQVDSLCEILSSTFYTRIQIESMTYIKIFDIDDYSIFEWDFNKEKWIMTHYCKDGVYV